MKLNNKNILGVLLVSIFVLGFTVLPISARAAEQNTTAPGATNAGARKAANAEMRSEVKTKLTATAIARGDREITNRIDSLNRLMTRVGDMKRLTDTQKASINTQITTLIGNLNALKAKIDADGASGTTTLKADLQSIIQLYRVYALVTPQIYILAAVDRIGYITNSLNTIVTKIDTRITAAQAAGKDVTAVNATFTDLKAKLADASTQTAAAFNLIVPLVPDNGDATKAASNKTALTTARADVKTAMQDVQAVWKDANTIAKALVAMKIKTNENASSTTTVTPASNQ